MRNPAKFDRCVDKVKRKSRGKANAYAVCTAAGTRNPNIAHESAHHWVEITPKGDYVIYHNEGTHSVKVSTIGPSYGMAKVRSEIERREVPGFYDQYKKKGRKSNPESAASSMYESFHGSPSEEVIEFHDQEHYHGNLAGLGVLVELKLCTITGYDVTLSFSDPEALVAANPGVWERLKKLSSRGKDPWVVFKSFDNESAAREEAGKLESKGVLDVRVDKKNVGGRFLGKKFKYEVQIKRESMKKYFKERALDESLQKALKRQREAQRHEKSHSGGKSRGSSSGSESSSAPKKKTYSFKGKTIEETDGEYVVPSIDRDSRFYDLKDAKAFITEHVKTNGKKKVGPFQSSSRLIGNVGAYLDNQLGRALNPGTSQDPALLCSNEAGTQLYIQGGDQSVDLKAIHMSDVPVKDSMILGEAYFVSYFTTKDFDQHKPTIYEHELAEESDKRRKHLGQGSGMYPTVRYDTLNQKLYLDGGEYHITKPMFQTSPGIEN